MPETLQMQPNAGAVDPLVYAQNVESEQGNLLIKRSSLVHVFSVGGLGDHF